MEKRKKFQMVELKPEKSSEIMFWLAIAVKFICIILVIILYTLAVWKMGAHSAEKKAAVEYQIKLQNYISERDAQDAARTAMPLSLKEQIQIEANSLAKVLYGVKDNSSDDLRTYCWCVFNRVDNPQFPNTLDDVINQPNQWMRYSETNDVLKRLKEIAVEELTTWHYGNERPCSNEFVYMDWSPNDLVLRDDFVAGRGTKYWRYS